MNEVFLMKQGRKALQRKRFSVVPLLIIGMLLGSVVIGDKIYHQHWLTNENPLSYIHTSDIIVRSKEKTLKAGLFGIPMVLYNNEKEKSLVSQSVYPPYEQIVAILDSLEEKYPGWIKLEEIGYSQFYQKPIIAAKISAEVEKSEDEPAVLFMGSHHAREPIGGKISLALIQYLLNNKNKPDVQRWLNGMSIWFVPCVNPDGYDYVINNHLKYPWWRKNLRDNNGDGIFEPEIDGVDLNRNYDFNWEMGGSSHAKSWNYRGRSNASESEIQAIIQLALRERFVLAIDYHSYGESVLYPWGREMLPPDEDLIRNIAANLAQNYHKSGRNTPYDIYRLNGKSGQSANWFYARLRAVSFIVEVAPDYFPNPELLPTIIDDQISGAAYLLSRVLATSISGHVFDRKTHKPLQAVIQFGDLNSPVVDPLYSDSKFGGFWRLVLPGEYTVKALMDSYQPTELPAIKVFENQARKIKIELGNPGYSE